MMPVTDDRFACLLRKILLNSGGFRDKRVQVELKRNVCRGRAVRQVNRATRSAADTAALAAAVCLEAGHGARGTGRGARGTGRGAGLSYVRLC